VVPHVQPIRVIGNGAFGYVFEAYDFNRKEKVALKRTQKVGNVVSREYDVLCLLRGKPNVIQLLDFFYSVDKQQRIVQNTVLEFCDCSLEDKLKIAEKTGQAIPIEQIKHFSRQMFNGLHHMHAVGVSHRDLKPENILLKARDASKFESYELAT